MHSIVSGFMERKMKGAVNNLKHDDLHQVANDRVLFQHSCQLQVVQPNDNLHKQNDESSELARRKKSDLFIGVRIPDLVEEHVSDFEFSCKSDFCGE